MNAVHRAFAEAPQPGLGHKEALIAVRKLYLGENDPIRPEDLWHFGPDAGERAEAFRPPPPAT